MFELNYSNENGKFIEIASRLSRIVYFANHSLHWWLWRVRPNGTIESEMLSPKWWQILFVRHKWTSHQRCSFFCLQTSLLTTSTASANGILKVHLSYRQTFRSRGVWDATQLNSTQPKYYIFSREFHSIAEEEKWKNNFFCFKYTPEFFLAAFSPRMIQVPIQKFTNSSSPLMYLRFLSDRFQRLPNRAFHALFTMINTFNPPNSQWFLVNLYFSKRIPTHIHITRN